MDNMEVSCVFYVKVSMFTHLEQSKNGLLTVNDSGRMTLTVQHDMIVCITFMLYPRDNLRQTSAAVRSLELHPINIKDLGDSGGLTLQCIPFNKQTISDRLFVICGVVGNPCNLQPYSVGFILSITVMSAATYTILTSS